MYISYQKQFDTNDLHKYYTRTSAALKILT